MSNSRQNMYILDYNENSTAQYMYKQAVLHTKLSNRLYPIQYISQHDKLKKKMQMRGNLEAEQFGSGAIWKRAVTLPGHRSIPQQCSALPSFQTLEKALYS